MRAWRESSQIAEAARRSGGEGSSIYQAGFLIVYGGTPWNHHLGRGPSMREVVHDQREVRRARYAVAAVFAVHGAVTGSFATRVPWIQDHASVSAGQLGFALAFTALGASCSMPLAGSITHRLGSRTALRALLALWTLSLLLPALAPNLPLL